LTFAISSPDGFLVLICRWTCDLWVITVDGRLWFGNSWF